MMLTPGGLCWNYVFAIAAPRTVHRNTIFLMQFRRIRTVITALIMLIAELAFKFVHPPRWTSKIRLAPSALYRNLLVTRVILTGPIFRLPIRLARIATEVYFINVGRKPLFGSSTITASYGCFATVPPRSTLATI